jgi:hypothetical protein
MLPYHPASPQPAIQEPSAELEKSPSPTREARNDVSMKIHSFILFNSSPLIRQVFLSMRELRHHPVFPLLRMT